MENKIWFKRKSYGWGWTPSTREGWLVLLIYFVYLFFFWNLIQYFLINTIIDLIIWSLVVLISTGTFVFICYKKGEKPKWQWGKDNS